MKQLLLPFCLLLAQMGTACVIEESEGSGGASAPPRLDNSLYVAWDLVAGDLNASAACPEAAASVQIVAEPLAAGSDGEWLDIGFACGDTGGVIENMAAGPYLIWVDIIDAEGALLAQSGTQEILVTSGSRAELSYTISLDQGQIGLAWTITDGGGTITCEDAGAVTIWVVSIHEDTGEELYDSLPCEDGQGSTRGLPIGSYQGEVFLLDEGNRSLGPPHVFQGTIEFGSDYYDLGTVELQLDQ